MVELEPVPTATASLTAYQEDVVRSISLLQDAQTVDELLRRAAPGGPQPRGVRSRGGLSLRARRPRGDRRGVQARGSAGVPRAALSRQRHPGPGARALPPEPAALHPRRQRRAGAARAAGQPGHGRLARPLAGVLRAVSPIHIQYLKNMGATASMSIALSVRDRLWGLISAHHYSGPLLVPHEVRATCELIGIVGSMQLEALEQLEASELRVKLARRRSAVLDKVAASASIVDGLAGGKDLLAVCNAEGAAVRIGDELRLIGRTPERPRSRRCWRSSTAGDRRARALPGSSRAEGHRERAGDRAARARARQLIVWFRPEYVRTITWAHATQEPRGRHAAAVARGRRRSGGSRLRRPAGPWAARVDSGSSVAELRSWLGMFLITRAGQLAALNAELARSNDELDAFVYDRRE